MVQGGVDMSYRDAIEILATVIWMPTDQTRSFWMRDTWGGVSWSENDEKDENPDNWDDSYSSETFREVTESGGYVIGEVDDGGGGTYQLIFSSVMEILDSRFK